MISPNYARQSTWYKLKKRLPRFVIHVVLFIISLLFLLPLLLIISVSFSDEKAIANNGYSLLPDQFTLSAYQFIFNDATQILNSYLVTILVTAIGSAVSLLIMSLLAYSLSRRDFSLRNVLSFVVFFTMLFNGGLVPWYILLTQYYHLKDTLWVLILPYLVVPWFVLLLRTYFAALPQELLEAARIDGAGEWRTFFQIVVPLSAPALATVGLFSMLLYWNDWWLGLLFIDDKNLVPLQYLLFKLQSSIDFMASAPQPVGVPVPAQSVRMAMAVLAIGPIAFAFLLVQKFFVRGITVGGVKG